MELHIINQSLQFRPGAPHMAHGTPLPRFGLWALRASQHLQGCHHALELGPIGKRVGSRVPRKWSYIYIHIICIYVLCIHIYIYWKCKIYICRIISGGARRIYIIHITGWKGPHGGWFRELIHYFPERLLPQGLILRSEGAVDGLCMIMYVRSYLRPRRM
jgi:hypothetical protein